MRLHFWVVELTMLLLVLGGCCRAQDDSSESGMLTVYYFPIGAETLTPITSASIEERGKHCEIHRSANTRKIKKILHDAVKPPSQKFSDTAVRVKLLEASSDGNRLLAIVENEGEVRFPDGTEGQVSRKGLSTLKKVIESQCGQ